MPHGLRVFVASALLILGLVPAWGQGSPQAEFRPGPGQGAYLVFTDVHFDPFAAKELVPQLAAAPVEGWREILEKSPPGLSPFGRDTNYPLLRSALEAASATGNTYDFILMPGDFLAHDFAKKYAEATGGPAGYAEFVEKTMVFVARLVQERFPGIPVIGTFGNNDSTCGDYAISPESTLFPKLADEWAVLKANPAAAADFRVGGSYALVHPTVPRQRIVVVNDIYWSQKYKDCDPKGGDAGPAMLAWLEWQLYQAARVGDRVTLVFHIPPGIDGYASAYSKGSCAAATTPFLEKSDSDRFLDIIDRYRAVLALAVVGHTHMDEFRVISSVEGAPLLPLKIFPAVSPIFGNAPAFTVVAYDKSDGSLDDYATFDLRNLPAMATAGVAPDWQLGYRFSEAYGRPAFDALTAASLATAIREVPSVRDTFTRFYAGLGAGEKPITAENWRAFSCAQTEMQPTDYTACSCGGGAN